MSRADQAQNFTAQDVESNNEKIARAKAESDRQGAYDAAQAKIEQLKQDNETLAQHQTDAMAASVVSSSLFDSNLAQYTADPNNLDQSINNPASPSMVALTKAAADADNQMRDIETQLTKNALDLAKAQQDMAMNAPNHKEASLGIMGSLGYTVNKDLADLTSPHGQAAQATQILGGVEDAFTGFQQAMLDATQSSDGFWKSLTGGAKDGQNAFTAFGLSVLQTMQKVAMNEITKRFAQMLFGSQEGLTASGGSVGGGLFGTIISAGASTLAGLFGNTGTAGVSNTTAMPSINDAALTSTPMPMQMPMSYRAQGGSVTGGTPYMDSVPTMLTPTEYVLPTDTVSAIGTSFLNDLRANPEATMDKAAAARMQQAPAQGKPHMTNVYVVSKDNVPATMGANDIVAAVADNVQRGGSLKTLIKSVQTGNT